MKKAIHWLDENLEEFILILLLISMTLIMGIQVFCRYALGMSLSWSEELTRYFSYGAASSVSVIAAKNACPSRLNNSWQSFRDAGKQFLR